MKGKEEDEEKNQKICPQRTDTQSTRQFKKVRKFAHKQRTKNKEQFKH